MCTVLRIPLYEIGCYAKENFGKEGKTGSQAVVKDRVQPIGRVTIRTVAAHAGVSVPAVSKVLRNAYGVSDQLRKKVEASIEHLEYRPNIAARSLRGRTNTIGLLLIDASNPFLSQIIEGANQAILPANYKMMIGVSQASAVIERSFIEGMIDFRLDGLILVSPRLPDETLEALARQVPIVVIGQHIPGSRSLDTVNADDRLGARQVVEAFVAEGYRDIAMVATEGADQTKPSVSDMRCQGYLEAMEEAGLSDKARITCFPETFTDCEGDVTSYLRAPDRPRAVFCWSDIHGVPMINAARGMGLRVPEDIAIAGFDNTAIAALPLVDLASVDQRGAELGATAAAYLFERIEGRTDVRNTILPTALVRRGSL